MPFPKNNVQFKSSFGSCQITTAIEDETTGVITTRKKDCNEKLPDAENFEIANQVKAGVAMQEVNTNILSSKTTPNEKDLEEAIKTITKNNKQKTTTEKEN